MVATKGVSTGGYACFVKVGLSKQEQRAIAHKSATADYLRWNMVAVVLGGAAGVLLGLSLAGVSVVAWPVILGIAAVALVIFVANSANYYRLAETEDERTDALFHIKIGGAMVAGAAILGLAGGLLGGLMYLHPASSSAAGSMC